MWLPRGSCAFPFGEGGAAQSAVTDEVPRVPSRAYGVNKTYSVSCRKL